ncbi:hypothetical protein SHKM778_38750 [Streptomyces sp. KM77-8]|uniref:Polyketide hydroxylase n=1 Tax=Streptomyces haneummycinicus TaxID=3074435 RepID=A0AAT9HJ69_9ACTN
MVGADPDTAVVPDGVVLNGEPGSRAPHLWMRRGGARISTLDLYERAMVLLSSESGGWHAAGAEVAASLSVPLDSYRVGAGTGADLAPEPGPEWAAAHGITPSGAVLVRPDGFVAWRHEGESADPAKSLREAVTRVLSRD